MNPAAPQAARFYEDVIRTGVVWTVRGDAGYPATMNPGGVRAMPWWSTRSRVARIIKLVPAYRDLVPVSFSWERFCAEWAPLLERDGVHVGVNWSGPRAIGFDMEPHELIEIVKRRREARLHEARDAAAGR